MRVKKGEFAVGDLGLYLEIDTVPPDTEAFRFLWQRRASEGEVAETMSRPTNYRVRTMKLRCALSQGVLLPRVEKYEPPIPVGMGEFRAQFPGFLHKTDEMRVQSVPAVADGERPGAG